MIRSLRFKKDVNVALGFLRLILKLCPIQVVISLSLWIKLTMGQFLLLFLCNFFSFFSYSGSVLVTNLFSLQLVDIFWLFSYFAITGFSIWFGQLLVHTPPHVPLVWCMQKVARPSSVYGTYCLGYWNEENERAKTSNWTVEYFFITFVKLSLA